jgi:two-component system, NarL family, response regulator LiaR
VAGSNTDSAIIDTRSAGDLHGSSNVRQFPRPTGARLNHYAPITTEPADSRLDRFAWLAEASEPSTPERSSPVRVLIVDDHWLVRQGLRMFLELDPAIEVVGDVADGESAIKASRELRPDVVMMDFAMRGLDGYAATAAIRAECPATAVIILTGGLETASVITAVRAGAIGCLSKTMSPTELCRVVVAAAKGQAQLSPEASAILLREVRNPEPLETLSERERDIAALLIQGRSNKEMASALHIGEKTVKTHMTNIMGKLGVQSRTQAALRFASLGLGATDSVPRSS